MKFLIVVVILVAVCGSVICGKEEWEEILKQCSQKNNVKVEDFRKIMEAQGDATADMKCFSLCAAEMSNVIKDGMLQSEGLTKSLSDFASKDEIAKLATDCNLKGADNCDTGFKIMSCIAKNKFMIKM